MENISTGGKCSFSPAHSAVNTRKLISNKLVFLTGGADPAASLSFSHFLNSKPVSQQQKNRKYKRRFFPLILSNINKNVTLSTLTKPSRSSGKTFHCRAFQTQRRVALCWSTVYSVSSQSLVCFIVETS